MNDAPPPGRYRVEDQKLNGLAKSIHHWVREKGFWPALSDGWVNRSIEGDFPDVNLILAKLMLVTTEVAETAEAVRKGNFSNYQEEIADTIIRLLDLAAATGVDVDGWVEAKMLINEGRPFMHGKLA